MHKKPTNKSKFSIENCRKLESNSIKLKTKSIIITVYCYLLFVICYLLFVICYLLFIVYCFMLIIIETRSNQQIHILRNSNQNNIIFLFLKILNFFFRKHFVFEFDSILSCNLFF